MFLLELVENIRRIAGLATHLGVQRRVIVGIIAQRIILDASGGKGSRRRGVVLLLIRCVAEDQLGERVLSLILALRGEGLEALATRRCRAFQKGAGVSLQ